MPTLPLNIKQFIVPDYVYLDMPVGRRQDGMQSLPKIYLKDLSLEILEELCADFRLNVLTLAGHLVQEDETEIARFRSGG